MKHEISRNHYYTFHIYTLLWVLVGGILILMTLTGILASAIITIVPLGGELWSPEDICWGDTWGTYIEGKIYVCDNDEFTEQYKQHELGHFVEDKYLTQDQREQYKALYNKHHKIGIRAFQREYWYSDWQESWAEDYASWKTWEKVNIYTKKRIKLIISLLK